MYNYELELISYVTGVDDIGNSTKTPVVSPVLCKVSSIGQREFYQAATEDMKPTIKFTIHKFEYDNQRAVKYKGEEYSVIRTFELDNQIASRYDKFANLGFDEIELTCERVVGS